MILPDLSIVLTTYNRCDQLTCALDALLSQERCSGINFELIVVDNNSTDRTAQVVAEYQSAGRNLVYILERKQGVSYARNAGIQNSTAPIVAFVDDDVVVSPSWVRILLDSLAEHPEVDCIGGPVLPRWEHQPPSWLDRTHWAPVALQDYGNSPFLIDKKKKLCLLSANFAFRRGVFDRIGTFDPALQRIEGAIGSMEDMELLDRFWEGNRTALYEPALVTFTPVPAVRMTTSYHRRWHTGHGHFYALMRATEMERTSRRIADVPAHLFRQALIDALSWVGHHLAGHKSQAFKCETRLFFFAGFLKTRIATRKAAGLKQSWITDEPTAPSR